MLSSAVKEQNRGKILGCFNFEGADMGTGLTIENAVNQICRWPTSIVFTTERAPGGEPLRSVRDGRTYGLNGDWEFQVHIFVRREQPSKGYVFPAGKTANGKYAVLVLVPQAN